RGQQITHLIGRSASGGDAPQWLMEWPLFEVLAWGYQNGISNAADIQIDHRKHVFSPHFIKVRTAPDLSNLFKVKKDHIQWDARWMNQRQPKPGEQHHHPSAVVVGSRAAGHAIVMRSQDKTGPRVVLKPDDNIYRMMAAELLLCARKGRIHLA